MKILFLLILLTNIILANNYPNRTIEVIVGLGEGEVQTE